MALDTSFQQSEVHHPQCRAWGAVPGPVFRKLPHSFSLAQTARTGKISDFCWTKETLTISNLSLVSFYRNKTCAVMIHKCSSRDCQGCSTPAPPSSAAIPGRASALRVTHPGHGLCGPGAALGPASHPIPGGQQKPADQWKCCSALLGCSEHIHGVAVILGRFCQALQFCSISKK